jgi:hypothetical protein
VPGIIGALWGIFLFKEIQGKKNYLLLFLTSLTAAICAICIVISKN